MPHNAEIQVLNAEIETLRQLLEVHEKAVFDEARRRQEWETRSLAQQAELEQKNLALLEGEREKNEALLRLRLAVEELSTPILDIWDDVLALPVIGVVDSRRASKMMERLLEEVMKKQTEYVILDITGVEVIDTATADYFVKLIRAVELMGTRCLVTGIGPAVAQTLTAIGAELGELRTVRTLKHALRECLRQKGRSGAKSRDHLSLSDVSDAARKRS